MAENGELKRQLEAERTATRDASAAVREQEGGQGMAAAAGGADTGGVRGVAVRHASVHAGVAGAPAGVAGGYAARALPAWPLAPGAHDPVRPGQVASMGGLGLQGHVPMHMQQGEQQAAYGVGKADAGALPPWPGASGAGAQAAAFEAFAPPRWAGWSGRGGGDEEAQRVIRVEGGREDGDVRGEAARKAQEHALEMLQLEQDTARLKMIKELTEMEEAMANRRLNQEREAWLVQQRRGLQEAQHLRSTVLPGSNYDPVEGFKLRFDLLQPLPRGVHQALVVYGLYDGPSALMPLQSSTMRDVVLDVKRDGGRRTWLDHVRTFKKLPPTEEVVCVVEVQEVAADGVSQPVGWTVIPLFDQEHRLLAGAWTVPLLEPPVKLQLTSAAGLRAQERFDVLESLPRVMVEDFAGLHGQEKASNEVEARLYVRLRACLPQPSPDDLDYDRKMAELASASRDDWPQVPLSDYQAAYVFRLPTPAFVRRPYTPSESVAEHAGEDEVAGAADSAGQAAASLAKAAKGTQRDAAVKFHKGVEEAAGDASMAAVPKEAWTHQVAQAEESGGGSGYAQVGPGDELLIILDGARFLPDNVSLSCATMCLVKPDGAHVTIASTSAMDAFGVPNARAQGVANLDSPLHSPTFDLSCSFRVGHCDPSAAVAN